MSGLRFQHLKTSTRRLYDTFKGFQLHLRVLRKVVQEESTLTRPARKQRVAQQYSVQVPADLSESKESLK